MNSERFYAILNPSGPHYETWRKIFGEDAVPLQSAVVVKGEIGEEKDVEVYKLNLHLMTLKQRAHLFGFISRTFGVSIDEVEAQVAEKSFPIRAVDVIVSISARAFL